MPVTKSAKRALRVSQTRRGINLKIISDFKKSVSAARKSKTAATLKSAYSALDRAAKKGVIHRQKAARLKSRLSKLVKSTPTVKKNKKKS